MILRSKGMTDADTIHGHALKAIFTPEYTQALVWLGAWKAVEDEDEDEDEDAYNGAYKVAWETPAPALVLDRLGSLGMTAIQLCDYVADYAPGDILSSIGIHGHDHLIGWGPKPPCEDILVVDEASMVGVELLTLCQQVFRYIILVAIMANCPVEENLAVLQTVPGITLGHVHRQAAGFTDFAPRVRGSQWPPTLALRSACLRPRLREVAQAQATAFLTSPLITWKNHTRRACPRSSALPSGIRLIAWCLETPGLQEHRPQAAHRWLFQ